MRTLQAAIVALLSVSQVLGESFYEGHMLSGPGVSRIHHADTFDDCMALCSAGAGCSGVSYHDVNSHCIITKCGNMVLDKRYGWYTYIPGDPVVAGDTIPVAAFEWGLTENCGVESVGSFGGPSMITIGTDFENQRSALFGKAMHFPNSRNDQGVNGRTNPHAAIAALADIDTSLTVSFLVYFNVLPPYACFVEFETAAAWSYHFWAYPNMQTVFANLVAAPNNGQGFTWPISYTAKAWHHVVYSYDASSAVLTAYVNGTQVGKQAMLYAAKKPFTNVIIGGRPRDKMGFWNGSMYCLSIYNHSLSAAQVADLGRACVDGKVRVL